MVMSLILHGLGLRFTDGLFTPPTRSRQNCLVDGVNKP